MVNFDAARINAAYATNKASPLTRHLDGQVHRGTETHTSGGIEVGNELGTTTQDSKKPIFPLEAASYHPVKPTDEGQIRALTKRAPSFSSTLPATIAAHEIGIHLPDPVQLSATVPGPKSST